MAEIIKQILKARNEKYSIYKKAKIVFAFYKNKYIITFAFGV